MKTLVLGGARSGKSRLAEQLAGKSGLPVTYIATARVQDEEMAARIEHHRQARDAHWQTIEEPVALSDQLKRLSTRKESLNKQCVLVDCLTLWLTNLLCDDQAPPLEAAQQALIETVAAFEGRLIMVSNEVGLGVVPMDVLSRRFVDEAGRLHQQLAQRCDQVIFTVAGLPQYLKGQPQKT